jgi:1,2-dihydroxy-3-keto-5-methylthiopentene dioxygenase
MSELKIYPDTQSSQPRVYTDHAAIQRELAAIGIRFERWEANRPLPTGVAAA